MDLVQLPLSALLSQTLVAFTIVFDNESEHRAPHRTSNFGSTEGDGPKPWMTSLVMYENCLRYVPDQGVTVGELEALARTHSNLGGMRRWGYITIDPKPLNMGGKGIKPSSFVMLKAGGKRVKEIYQPLFAEIEQCWRTRFGDDAIGDLRQSLETVVGRLDPKLPDCMPIVGYGLVTKGQCEGSFEIGEVGRTDTAGLSLYTLLAKVLVAFALAYEDRPGPSLAVSANILRVLNEEGVPARDIPVLAGVSKESIAMAEGYLVKQGYVEVNCGSGRLIRLTQKGLDARNAYFDRVRDIDEHWRMGCGADAILALRASLEKVVGAGDRTSPLFDGLEPYPEGWRAKVKRPATLPHFPMVLHRGGYPDGS